MKKTTIEWADMSWNPVTGCYHGCPYCYAERIANRFKDKSQSQDWILSDLHEGVKDSMGRKEPYPYGFRPTFFRYRLDDPQKVKGPRRVFVCSMADLFGEWVPDEWITAVMEACRKAPQHRYLFLTKNPARYDRLIDSGIIRETDGNFWLGSTVTDLTKPMHWNSLHHTFMSCEPVLAPWPPARESGDPYKFPEWVILGAETGSRKGKVVPEKEWIDNIVAKCRMMRASVMMKDSLIPIVGEKNMIREFPRGLCL